MSTIHGPRTPDLRDVVDLSARRCVTCREYFPPRYGATLCEQCRDTEIDRLRASIREALRLLAPEPLASIRDATRIDARRLLDRALGTEEA